MKTLEALSSSPINWTVYLGRELTKMHEEMLIGNAKEILQVLESEPVRQKGEFVVIVDKN